MEEDAVANEEEQQHIEQVVEHVIGQQCGAKSTKCAAHVIQLASKDFIKSSGRLDIVKELKDVVRDVRKYIKRLPLNPANPPYPRMQMTHDGDLSTT